MDNLNETHSKEALLFYNPEDLALPHERERNTFPLTILPKEFRKLRYALANNDVMVPLDISVNADERQSDDDIGLRFEAYGKRYLQTDAVVVQPPLISHVSRDYFRSICEANADPNVIACIGIVAA